MSQAHSHRPATASLKGMHADCTAFPSRIRQIKTWRLAARARGGPNLCGKEMSYLGAQFDFRLLLREKKWK